VLFYLAKDNKNNLNIIINLILAALKAGTQPMLVRRDKTKEL
jgi:hypothetical protein